jgi:hypothetical protein
VAASRKKRASPEGFGETAKIDLFADVAVGAKIKKTYDEATFAENPGGATLWPRL